MSCSVMFIAPLAIGAIFVMIWQAMSIVPIADGVIGVVGAASAENAKIVVTVVRNAGK